MATPVPPAPPQYPALAGVPTDPAKRMAYVGAHRRELLMEKGAQRRAAQAQPPAPAAPPGPRLTTPEHTPPRVIGGGPVPPPGATPPGPQPPGPIAPPQPPQMQGIPGLPPRPQPPASGGPMPPTTIPPPGGGGGMGAPGGPLGGPMNQNLIQRRAFQRIQQPIPPGGGAQIT